MQASTLMASQTSAPISDGLSNSTLDDNPRASREEGQTRFRTTVIVYNDIIRVVQAGTKEY